MPHLPRTGRPSGPTGPAGPVGSPGATTVSSDAIALPANSSPVTLVSAQLTVTGTGPQLVFLAGVSTSTDPDRAICEVHRNLYQDDTPIDVIGIHWDRPVLVDPGT